MRPAISVSAVSKRFRIPLDKSTTLKYRFTHLRSAGRFHDLFALREVTFDVAPGEFVGIIGGNGSGKSTLLKILSRIYRPTTGAMTIGGRVSPFLELGVGFNPELTARANVFLNGAILGLSRGDLETRFDKIIDFAGLREFVDQKLKNFSSGMQVRLAFSVAIQAKADILLMDEVLAVGDAEFQEKCFDVFARYKRQGKTVVLVTHDMSAVENYCDRALLFDHGILIADGSSSDVTMQYRHRVGQSLNSDPSIAGDDDSEPRRWGTREVKITNVCILNQEGRPATTVPSGSCISVEIEFEAESDVGEIVCGVALHRADGLHIAGSNTKLGGIEVPSPRAGMRDRVRYTVDRLNVNAGSYLLSASVYDRHSQHAYDEIPLAYPLRITEDVTSHGVIDLQGRWTHG